MADEVKQTPSVMVGGNVASEPAFGAYAPDNAKSLARIVSSRTPYSMLEKTGRLAPPTADEQTRAAEVSDALFARMRKKSATEMAPSGNVMDSNNRWLRELGITSASTLDFQKAWETDTYRRQKSEHEWRDTYGGKLAIRTFSRGIMGSAFFAAGQHIAGHSLKNYGFDYNDASKNTELHNPLEYVARLLDKTIGTGIYKAAYAVTKDKAKAANVVTFRHTNQWNGYGKLPDGSAKPGRSYGHEGLAVTFDFGLASLGDYMGREIAGLVDPNTEKKWIKDGHVDVPAATKALLKSTWTGVTKAMGEDYFAMATGYPYIVRGTRNMIDKFSPGFKYDSDHWGNGGSFKVDNYGKIIGNYQLEGMTDLALRFSAYNVQTKIFRDLYDKGANQFKHFWEGDRALHLPHFDTPPTPANLAKKTVDGVGAAAHYLVRTAIKIGLVMVPSSTVFAFIRSAQSKDIGLAINPERGPVGMVGNVKGKPEFAYVYASGTAKSPDSKRSSNDFPINESTRFAYKDGTEANFNKFVQRRSKDYVSRFDPYGQNVAWHDKLTNPVGRFCNESGHTLAEILKPAARLFGGKNADMGAVSKHSQRFIDATYCYTPYFMLKTDLCATFLDTPKTDMAIDRTIDGVTHLKWNEVKSGLGEVLHVIEGRPFIDPDREALAQKKMRNYTNQLWSNQDEIIAKEREQEKQDQLDANLSLGKPIALNQLYRQPFAERVGRRNSGAEESANDAYYAQNITPMPVKKPEDYKKPEQQSWKQQANSSWGQKTIRDFQNTNSSQGQTIN